MMVTVLWIGGLWLFVAVLVALVLARWWKYQRECDERDGYPPH